MTYAELQWNELREPLADDQIAQLEGYFGVRLPADYRDCLKRYHGAYPQVSDFWITTKDGDKIGSCVGVLLTADMDDPENIIATFEGMGQYKAKGVVPIADDGGGDFVCLDFREHRREPQVCYFQAELGRFEYVAGSFAGFCRMLQKPDDA